MNRKQIILFIAAFVVLLAGRLLIAGTGYLEDQDEFLYIWIHAHFAGFAHLSTWTRCVLRMQGQPPEIAIRLFEYISILPVSKLMGKQMLHPDILYFIGLYNILVSLLILYVFFRILLKLNFSFALSLAGIFLLGTMFNFNLYTRHILPYDTALLFQLMAFNLLLRKNTGTGTILLAGLLSAIGLTNYLGCFMFIFINGGYLVLSNYKAGKVAAKKVLLFILPFVLLVACYQLLIRMDGNSYLNFITGYYGTLDDGGSFDEGIIYVFLYFYMVEKWWGILLLILFFAGSILLFKKSDSVNVKQALLLGITGYVTYGVYVFFFHKMVFEGRILHIYYPFIIIGVLGFIKYQKILRQNYLVYAVILFAAINYGFVIRDFNEIGYPRNAVYKYHLFEDPGKVKLSYYTEISPCIQYSNRMKYFIDTVGENTLAPGNYVADNICFLPDVTDSVLMQAYKPWMKTEGDSVVFEQLHFESHPAYTLEYCNRFAREFYIRNQMKIRLIKTKAP